ncbi:cysteine protease inhibitor 8-like [Lycium barbarum]|uniref:cysteine protease inhibitor 8-like n=1 Tax=Lycium barbarum TaxID=112863 RepID=UPI00293F0D18|nr:cysteine protease inhibitor 8-like [Lycium barbarum]
MKSIFSFLLLTTFSLVPFVAFSSTFTSDDPIVLPTTTEDDINVLPEVLDMDGQPLKTGEPYTILNTLFGGGSVALVNIGNTRCPNAIVQKGELEKGTPLTFFTKKSRPTPFDVVHEMNDIDIMFTVATSSCINETVWKVGNPDRFVVTGGTLGNNFFKIVKAETKPGSYHLRYCLGATFLCLNVGLTRNNRLALNNQPIPFGFVKHQKTDA